MKYSQQRHKYEYIFTAQNVMRYAIPCFVFNAKMVLPVMVIRIVYVFYALLTE